MIIIFFMTKRPLLFEYASYNIGASTLGPFSSVHSRSVEYGLYNKRINIWPSAYCIRSVQFSYLPSISVQSGMSRLAKMTDDGRQNVIRIHMIMRFPKTCSLLLLDKSWYIMFWCVQVRFYDVMCDQRIFFRWSVTNRMRSNWTELNWTGPVCSLL